MSEATSQRIFICNVKAIIITLVCAMQGGIDNRDQIATPEVMRVVVDQ